MNAIEAGTSLVSTLYEPDRSIWSARVLQIDRREKSRTQLIGEIFKASRGCRAMVLNGSIAGYSDVMAAALIARGPKPPALVLADCTWKVETNWKERVISRLGLRAIDGSHVAYCVLSRDEQERFARTWGVDAARVFFTPWYHGLPEEELQMPTSEDGDIFAGGDSLRDYAPLIEAVRGMDVSVKIAAKRFPKDLSLPKNVSAGPVPPVEYNALSRRARIVVVPLERREDRSAGQFTYLSAMAMGKLVIVTESLGVHDYIEHQKTGLIVSSDPRSLRAALDWALEPSNRDAVDAIRRRARETVRARFTADRYLASLLSIAHTMMDMTGVARGPRPCP